MATYRSVDSGEGIGPPGRLALWQEICPKLKRMIAALGCPGDAADDVLQDVYLSMIRHGDNLPDREGLRRWLFRVTINRSHLENRMRNRQRRLLLRLATRLRRGRRDTQFEDLASRRDEQEAVRSALADLDHALKAPLVLRYFQGMSLKEIGDILEMPDWTVRRRLQEARMKLAAELRRAGYGND